MNSLVNRGRDLESQYHHHQLHEFKILRTRNRLFSSWVAQTLNMVEEQNPILVQITLDSMYCTVKGDLLIHEVLVLFKEQGRSISESHLRKQLNYFYHEATKDNLTL